MKPFTCSISTLLNLKFMFDLVIVNRHSFCIKCLTNLNIGPLQVVIIFNCLSDTTITKKILYERTEK